ncbi:MAG: hypothetical protein PHV90_10775 [Smithella sp.]|nr:hypothetical protein [Smithella sp.]
MPSSPGGKRSDNRKETAGGKRTAVEYVMSALFIAFALLVLFIIGLFILMNGKGFG